MAELSGRIERVLTRPRAAVLMVLMVALAGCSDGPAPTPTEVFGPMPAIDKPGKSPSLTAEVYIDATLSMQGFVKAGAITQYKRFIEALERAFVSGWAGAHVKFFKFGSTVKPVSSRGYLDALDPSFYTEPGIFRTTRVDQVLKLAAGDRLLIVLTDLYQRDSNVAAMISALREHVFAKSLTLAVVGFRSDFNGTIYDVTPAGLEFAWHGQRPFYALIAGRRGDVIAYVTEMRRTLGAAAAQVPVMILAPSLLAASISLTDDTTVTSKAPLRQNSAVGPRPGGTVLAFDLPRGGGEPGFSVKSPLDILADAPLLDFTGLKADVTAKRRPKRQWYEFKTREIETAPDSALSSHLVPGSWAPGQSKGWVQITVGVAPDRMVQGGLYMYELRFYARAGALRLPPWVANWSLSPQAVAVAAVAGRIDGTKTLNLTEFLDDALTVLLNVTRQEIGRLHIYVAFDA